jgi:hypothetical protein
LAEGFRVKPLNIGIESTFLSDLLLTELSIAARERPNMVGCQLCFIQVNILSKRLEWLSGTQPRFFFFFFLLLFVVVKGTVSGRDAT